MIAATGLAMTGLGSTAGAQTTEGLTPLGTYESGATDEGGAEIVDYDPATQQLYVTNGFENKIDIIDISDPTDPTQVTQVDLAPYGGGGVQSVAVGDGEFAAAVDNTDPTLNGKVVRFTTAGVFIAEHEVGNLPDAITYTPDGSKIVVANEGEPICKDDPDEGELLVDPEGSVSIIDIATPAVTNAVFTAFDKATLLSENVRIFFPGSTAAQDIEPEYVTTNADGSTAYVTLQENNAIAVVDIATSTVTDILPLGFKDHSVAGNGLDPSNEDGPTGDGIENIQLWDVLGMYQPDAIAVADIDGTEYLLTANEGDARDYDCYSEEERVKDFGVAVPPYAATDGDDENLGRLRTTSAFPTTFNGAMEIEQVYSYGARSFTIWDPTTGDLVFDSGDEFEQTLLGTPQWVESRNDDKGPEPEALAVGEVNDRMFAFIGLERSGGVMMYEITDPTAPTLIEYVNTSTYDVDGDPETDVGPEGLVFISAEDSPTDEALIAVSYEIDGTTGIFQVDVDDPPTPSTTTPTTTTIAPTTTISPTSTVTPTTTVAPGAPTAKLKGPSTIAPGATGVFELEVTSETDDPDVEVTSSDPSLLEVVSVTKQPTAPNALVTTSWRVEVRAAAAGAGSATLSVSIDGIAAQTDADPVTVMPVELPATGSSNAATIWIALMLLGLGTSAITLARRW